MRKPERKGLGRGLTALLADAGPTDEAGGATGAVQTLAIDQISANPNQPRRMFGDAELEELASSIRRSGIIQPIVVRPTANLSPDASDPEKTSRGYQLVAGERRWRAAQRAQLHEVPVVIRELDDEETLELAIVENVQRVDLNPLEEALGYRQLIDRFGHTQEQVASALGKSRSHIANTLRLLSLPDAVQDHVSHGRLSAGHARALITSPDPAALAQEAIAKGLTVRQVEALAKSAPAQNAAPKTDKPAKDADTKAIEGELAAQLGMAVQIDHAPGQDGGTVRIRYKSLEDLDNLLRLLSGG